MPTLTNRLQCVADCIRKGRTVADIGTDHALLPVALISHGICPCAIAADIRPGPVASAKRTVSGANLTDVIDVRLGDGLSVVQPDEVDDIVIAGMGGETIAAILTEAPWVRQERYHLILQPMTRAECLRQYLLTNGFRILAEHVVWEGRRVYVVLEAAFGDCPPVHDPASYYIGGLDPVEGRPLLERHVKHLSRRVAALHDRGDTDEAGRLEHIAEQIRQYMGE